MRTVLVGLLVVLLGVLAPQHSAAAAYGSEAHTKAETKVEVAPRYVSLYRSLSFQWLERLP